MSKPARYWIGVACKDHVANGVRDGICQFCHGKAGPAKRLSKGDYLIYYSSKLKMDEPAVYQKFTAIGTVQDDEPYPFEMSPGFVPMRRNIQYFPAAQHVAIKPMVDELPFIKNKKSWGAAFRFGFLEIDEVSFGVIARAMLGHNPAAAAPTAEAGATSAAAAAADGHVAKRVKSEV